MPKVEHLLSEATIHLPVSTSSIALKLLTFLLCVPLFPQSPGKSLSFKVELIATGKVGMHTPSLDPEYSVTISNRERGAPPARTETT